MSYAGGNRQLPIRDFRERFSASILAEMGAISARICGRKSVGGNCLSLIAPHNKVFFERKIRTRLDLLSIPQSGGEKIQNA